MDHFLLTLSQASFSFKQRTKDGELAFWDKQISCVNVISIILFLLEHDCLSFRFLF